MARVRYAKNADELERGSAPSADGRALASRGVRAIRCVYETDAEVIQAVVPRPLEIPAHPEVEVVFASLGAVDRAAGDAEEDATAAVATACFGVRVEYDGVEGVYPLAMSVDDEASVARGRERFGEPRKLAHVELSIEEREGGVGVSARVARQGIDFLRATGRSVERLEPIDLRRVGYGFKAFPGCDRGARVDPNPQLVRTEWSHAQSSRWRLEGGIDLGESPFDPVSDLPVRRLVELEFTAGSLSIARRVLRPVPAEWLAPFIHQRYDDPATIGVDV